MSTVTTHTNTRTALTTSALNSLASATYASAGTIDLSADDPLDLILEVTVTPGTVAGNKQLLIFARPSLDGSHYGSGPASGTTATDEPNLRYIGALPLNTNAAQQRGFFSLASALGYIPPHVEIVVKNDSGAALAASGHAVHYATQVCHIG